MFAERPASPFCRFNPERTELHYRNSGGGEWSSTSPFGLFEQIERIGLDQQRPALALNLADLLDPRELVLQERPAARPLSST